MEVRIYPVQIGASSFSFRATVIHQTLESSLLCIVGYITKFCGPFGAKNLILLRLLESPDGKHHLYPVVDVYK